MPQTCRYLHEDTGGERKEEEKKQPTATASTMRKRIYAPAGKSPGSRISWHGQTSIADSVGLPKGI